MIQPVPPTHGSGGKAEASLDAGDAGVDEAIHHTTWGEGGDDAL